MSRNCHYTNFNTRRRWLLLRKSSGFATTQLWSPSFQHYRFLPRSWLQHHRLSISRLGPRTSILLSPTFLSNSLPLAFNMLFNSFSSLIQALRLVHPARLMVPFADPSISLTQGLFKPIPQLLDATKTLAAPLLNVVHDVSSPLLGITHDLTTPLVGAVKDIEGPILGAVKDVTAPLLGAVHDITQPILEPVKGIFDPVLDVVKDSSSLLGLPLSGLSLLNLLQNEASTNDQPSSQGPNTMQDTLDAAHAAAAASQVGALATQDTDNAPPVHNLAKLNVAQTQHDDSSCAVAPYDVNVEDVTFTPFDSVKSNIFRYRQQQSVNLGSWSVRSPTITVNGLIGFTGLFTRTG
jgi:hypothetical protein